MVPSYINPTTTIILYEKLDVSIVELETKRSLKIIWTGIHNKEEASYPFLLPKTSSVHDLADHLAKQVTLSPGGTAKIRVFEVSKDGKSQKEFTGSEMIGNIPEPVELYAEVCTLLLVGLFLSAIKTRDRKYLVTNLKRTKLARPSMSSTSIGKLQEHMVYPSDSS
jgi:hypothetical protein